MLYLLAYIESFQWIAFVLFLVVWCALAWNGRSTQHSSAPVRVPQKHFYWRRQVWR